MDSSNERAGKQEKEKQREKKKFRTEGPAFNSKSGRERTTKNYPGYTLHESPNFVQIKLFLES